MSTVALSDKDVEKLLVIFKRADDDGDGFVGFHDAWKLFGRSKLPASKMFSIWIVADEDKDNRLSFEEFMVAMRLIRREMMPNAPPLAGEMQPVLVGEYHQRSTETVGPSPIRERSPRAEGQLHGQYQRSRSPIEGRSVPHSKAKSLTYDPQESVRSWSPVPKHEVTTLRPTDQLTSRKGYGRDRDTYSDYEGEGKNAPLGVNGARMGTARSRDPMMQSLYDEIERERGRAAQVMSLRAKHEAEKKGITSVARTDVKPVESAHRDYNSGTERGGGRSHSPYRSRTEYGGASYSSYPPPSTGHVRRGGDVPPNNRPDSPARGSPAKSRRDYSLSPSRLVMDARVERAKMRLSSSPPPASASDATKVASTGPGSLINLDDDAKGVPKGTTDEVTLEPYSSKGQVGKYFDYTETEATMEKKKAERVIEKEKKKSLVDTGTDALHPDYTNAEVQTAADTENRRDEGSQKERPSLRGTIRVMPKNSLLRRRSSQVNEKGEKESLRGRSVERSRGHSRESEKRNRVSVSPSPSLSPVPSPKSKIHHRRSSSFDYDDIYKRSQHSASKISRDRSWKVEKMDPDGEWQDIGQELSDSRSRSPTPRKNSLYRKSPTHHRNKDPRLSPGKKTSEVKGTEKDSETPAENSFEIPSDFGTSAGAFEVPDFGSGGMGRGDTSEAFTHGSTDFDTLGIGGPAVSKADYGTFNTESGMNAGGEKDVAIAPGEDVPLFSVPEFTTAGVSAGLVGEIQTESEVKASEKHHHRESVDMSVQTGSVHAVDSSVGDFVVHVETRDCQTEGVTTQNASSTIDDAVEKEYQRYLRQKYTPDIPDPYSTYDVARLTTHADDRYSRSTRKSSPLSSAVETASDKVPSVKGSVYSQATDVGQSHHSRVSPQHIAHPVISDKGSTRYGQAAMSPGEFRSSRQTSREPSPLSGSGSPEEVRPSAGVINGGDVFYSPAPTPPNEPETGKMDTAADFGLPHNVQSARDPVLEKEYEKYKVRRQQRLAKDTHLVEKVNSKLDHPTFETLHKMELGLRAIAFRRNAILRHAGRLLDWWKRVSRKKRIPSHNESSKGAIYSKLDKLQYIYALLHGDDELDVELEDFLLAQLERIHHSRMSRASPPRSQEPVAHDDVRTRAKRFLDDDEDNMRAVRERLRALDSLTINHAMKARHAEDSQAMSDAAVAVARSRVARPVEGYGDIDEESVSRVSRKQKALENSMESIRELESSLHKDGVTNQAHVMTAEVRARQDHLLALCQKILQDSEKGGDHTDDDEYENVEVKVPVRSSVSPPVSREPIQKPVEKYNWPALSASPPPSMSSDRDIQVRSRLQELDRYISSMRSNDFTAATIPDPPALAPSPAPLAASHANTFTSPLASLAPQSERGVDEFFTPVVSPAPSTTDRASVKQRSLLF